MIDYTGPIWKDVNYESSADTLTYYIQYSGSTIFSGKAYKFPGSDRLCININKLCENYLNNDLPDFRGSGMTLVNDTACIDFELYDNGGELLGTYRFIYDWSYDFGVDYSGEVDMSHPINGRYMPGMYFFNTSYSGGVVTDTVTLTPGTGSVPGCGKYALYYLNAYGGWDGYLIEGNVIKSSGFERHMINKAYNNTGIEFEKTGYISEINTRWECHTGWLSDEESERVARHLLSTHRCYMHNLETDDVYPVVVTNNETEYKEFRNGRNLVSYTINLENSQNIYKR